MLSLEARRGLDIRLRRIEGQTRGIQRMLADGRECREVLNQLASVRAATRGVGLELMKHYLAACLDDTALLDSEEAVGDMVDVLLRL